MNDDDLRSMLAKWKAPEPAAALKARALAAFEESAKVRPWWKRLFTAKISIPLPVAAACLAVFLTLGYFAMRTPRTIVLPGTTVVQERIVQVPVVQEKVVTRKVYIRQRPTTPTRNEIAQVLAAGFEPVAQLKPEVIRRSYAQ